MSRWHRVASFVVYVVLPASMVLVSAFVLVSAVYQSGTEGLDEWGQPIVLGAVVTVGSLVLLILMNTRRARRRRDDLRIGPESDEPRPR